MRAFRPKALLLTLAAMIGLVAAIVVAGLPLYVFPPAEAVGKADLIYVIGPPHRDRVAVERAMHDEGVADLSLYSVSLHGGWSAAKHPVCREEGVVCEHPEPYTTKGEAAFLGQFAPEHGVKRTIVLTFTPHVSRTRYIFAKCYDGDVTVVAVDQHLTPADWVYQYAYQTLAFLKAWITPCADTSDL